MKIRFMDKIPKTLQTGDFIRFMNDTDDAYLVTSRKGEYYLQSLNGECLANGVYPSLEELCDSLLNYDCEAFRSDEYELQFVKTESL